MSELFLAIPSAGRPAAPAKLRLTTQGFSDEATWYVPPGEGDDYARAGARNVVEVAGTPGYAGNQAEARNRAMEDAFAQDRICVQMDDDFKNAKWMSAPTTKPTDIGFAEVLAALVGGFAAVPHARIAGASVTGNPFYYSKPIHASGFLEAQLLAIRPNTLRFDTTIRLKADYDLTLQHLSRYGAVARVEGLLVYFEHYSAHGGCTQYRSDAREDEAIARLIAKWPSYIKPNPKREHQVILKWRPS